MTQLNTQRSHSSVSEQHLTEVSAAVCQMKVIRFYLSVLFTAYTCGLAKTQATENTQMYETTR